MKKLDKLLNISLLNFLAPNIFLIEGIYKGNSFIVTLHNLDFKWL